LTVRIDFHPEATAELENAADWYVGKNPAAAARFAEAVDAALVKIQSTPERFLLVGPNLRACTVERFPYQIVFRVDPHRLYVLAVAHAKRRPGYWRQRS
jgi:plasmid stabilization system protein ParE